MLACTWTHFSSSNRIQGNYMGLKVTACMRSYGKCWTKDTKKSNCHFGRAQNKSRGSGAKAGYCACPLHTTSPKGWANHLSHRSSRTPGHTLTLTPCKEQARPSTPWPQGASQQGNLLFVLTPPCCRKGPNKALPEFLVWPLINFY